MREPIALTWRDFIEGFFVVIGFWIAVPWALLTVLT